MAWSEAVEKIKKMLGGALLSQQPFGAQKEPLLWFDPVNLHVALELLSRSSLFYPVRFDQLLAMQIDQNLVLTYVFKSPDFTQKIYLRGSLLFDNKRGLIQTRTASHLWPNAKIAEQEIARSYGVLFLPNTEFDHKKLEKEISSWFGSPVPPLRRMG